MKTLLLFIVLCVFASVVPVSAGTYVIPGPDSLKSLDHAQYAIWGINWTLPQGEVITSVRIKFYDLYNWDKNDTDNIMYVNLLDVASTGVVKHNDSLPGNQFAGQVLLGSYHDPDGPIHDEDISFYVPDNYFSLIADGNFGFGIDPDCHFYDSCVKVKIETECVPEPAPLIALCCGLSGMLGFVRRRRRA